MDTAPNPSDYPNATNASAGTQEAPADAFRSAAQYFAEFRSFAADYMSAKADAAKLSVRRIIIAAALGVLGFFAGVATIVTAVVLLLMGLANAIGALFHRPWVGQLIVSVLVLATIAIGAIVAIRKITGASKKKTVEKYERQHAEQRRRFGHDVLSAGSATPATSV